MSSADFTPQYIRQCVIAEAVLPDNQPFNGSVEFFREFVYLRQFRNETTFEYFERFKFYVDEFPNYGLPFDELINHFLYGMLPEERYELDVMAGGSIMDCTLRHKWSLIQERAEATSPYIEYNSEQIDLEPLCQLAQQLKSLVESVEKASEQMERLARDIHELKSDPPELFHEEIEFSLDNEVIAIIEEQKDEDTMDEELQEVPTTSIVDVPTKDLISPPCPDSYIEQRMVLTCNPTLPSLTDIVVSSDVQNFLIKEALDNKKVWSSLEKFKIHIPVVRAPKRKLNSEKLLDRWRANWKTRKKCKCMISEEEYSLDFVQIQKNHSIFGWKPGWDSWLNVLGKGMKAKRRRVRKFDGVHPWAPNIW